MTTEEFEAQATEVFRDMIIPDDRRAILIWHDVHDGKTTVVSNVPAEVALGLLREMTSAGAKSIG